MAAEQIPGGRVCCCGCQGSIDHLRKHAQYLPACRLRERNHRRRDRVKEGFPDTPIVRSAPGDNHSRPQRPCPVCAGMPWAREPDRYTVDPIEGGSEKDRVVNDNGRCRGCDEPYAPEPAPRPGAVLSSSAGMAIRASDVHGLGISSGRGVHARKSDVSRPSRAKFG